MGPRPPSSTLFPYTTLFRSFLAGELHLGDGVLDRLHRQHRDAEEAVGVGLAVVCEPPVVGAAERDRKSTRLNSSHSQISYAVFCLKKKNRYTTTTPTKRPLS